MNNTNGISVYSEIGKLKTVLLHCPGSELENIGPAHLQQLLFNEILYINQAQKEHNQFSDILKKEGVEVLYITELMAEVLKDNKIRKEFLDDFLKEGSSDVTGLKDNILEYLNEFSPEELIKKCVGGIKRGDIQDKRKNNLENMVKNAHPFYIDPIPNLYYQRDIFASVGKGISLSVMANKVRDREVLLPEYIFKYHPRFKGTEMWYHRQKAHTIEGGDILILSDKVVAIGISQRTHPIAIEKLAEKLLSSSESFEVILAFDIPKEDAYIHLDRVFTMVDYDKFTIYPQIQEPLDVYSITMDKNNKIKIIYEHDDLAKILAKHLNLGTVNLIKCGDGDPIAANREQWSDGSNTLAVAPGKVICYDRNYITNNALRKNGVEVLEIESYELSRGGGGPRCMSMPIVRDKS